MKRMYIVECWGNFSRDFGWDSGLDISDISTMSDSLVPEEHVFEETSMFLGDKITLEEVSEHGGSRWVYLLVKANTRKEVRKLVSLWSEHYYPQK